MEKDRSALGSLFSDVDDTMDEIRLKIIETIGEMTEEEFNKAPTSALQWIIAGATQLQLERAGRDIKFPIQGSLAGFKSWKKS